jgi:hypothetical protein
MLVEQAFHPRGFAAQPIHLAHDLLVIVGSFSQERHDLGPVEAAHARLEPLLPQIERRDAHAALELAAIRCADVFHIPAHE